MKIRRDDRNAQTVYNTASGSGTSSAGDASGDQARGEDPAATPGAARWTVRLRLEKKGRGGKAVTVLSGLDGRRSAIEALSRELKSLCGAGGTLRWSGAAAEIEVQGDHRPRIAARLRELGHGVKGA